MQRFFLPFVLLEDFKEGSSEDVCLTKEGFVNFLLIAFLIKY